MLGLCLKVRVGLCENSFMKACQSKLIANNKGNLDPNICFNKLQNFLVFNFLKNLFQANLATCFGLMKLFGAFKTTTTIVDEKSIE